MKIAATQYSLSYKALEIYISGCKAPHCEGCHNPELWDFSIGAEFTEEWKEAISSKVLKAKGLIDKFIIFGGEPLDANREQLIALLDFLRTFNKEIWIFTRYEFDEIPDEILKRISFTKCGRYLRSLVTNSNKQFGFDLATSNQYIKKSPYA